MLQQSSSAVARSAAAQHLMQYVPPSPWPAAPPACCILQWRAEFDCTRYPTAFCVALAAQVHEVDPDVIDTHAGRLQVFRLVWV
jgi:hypothetical protein